MNRLRIIFILVAAFSLAVGPACMAEEAIRLGAETGYGGTIVYARKMPVTVTLENGGADFTGTVSVDIYASAVDYDRYEMPVSLAAGATKRFVLPVTLGYRQNEFPVELKDAEGKTVIKTSVRPARAVGNSALLVGTLSNRQQMLSYFNEEYAGGNLYTGLGEPFSWETVALNADSFPADAQMLNAFSILVFDGFDARTLTDAQQAALSAWLEDGGIAIVGGGAQAALGYPFFEAYTGVQPGALLERTDVLNALREYAGVPLGEESAALMVNSLPGAAAGGCVHFSSAGSGAVVLTAFELGARAVSNASDMQGLWRKLLTAGAPDVYAAAVQAVQSIGMENGYSWNSALASLPVENARSGWPLALLLGAYLLTVGILCYILLKRLDKREWMWLCVPALAVVTAFCLLKMGAHLGFDRPMAVTGVEVIYQEDQADAKIYATVVSASNREVSVSSESGVIIEPYGYESSYGWYEDGNSAPTNLRYRYILTEPEQIMLPAASSWSTRYFVMEDSRLALGSIAGSAWMEEDGLHMEIVNGTQAELRDVIAYSGMGYAFTESIAPGATANLLLRRADAKEEEEILNAIQKSEADAIDTEGILLPGQAQALISDLYSVANIAMQQKLQREGNGADARLADAWLQAYRAAVQSYSSEQEGFTARIVCRMENMDVPALILDGRAIERTAQVAVARANLTYVPIGPTGVAFYPGSEIRARLLDLSDGDFDPKHPVFAPDSADAIGYYELTDEPAFLFEVPSAEAFVVKQMHIAAQGYYSVIPVAQLFNFATGAWDAFDLPEITLDDSAAAPYLSREGYICVRYSQPADADWSMETGSVAKPHLVLEGRVEE